MKIYNTATRTLEEFVPRTKGEAGMYVCGPTVYDDSHLGHARAMVAFDIVARWLAYRGFTVRYVRNITDVDDKIIARAAERKVTCGELAEICIERFQEDAERLSLLKPDVEPRATAHIREMIDLVSLLLERGHAYVSGGDVYYDVESFAAYGKLSGRNPDDLLAGARVEVNDLKKNPLDFALWKAAKPGEPAWESPWGSGRPGWHIECSAMSSRYLGAGFDIHGGGQDLIFPHHENEIAQFEAATGKPFVRYWMHNAHVTVNETKMSKSLGNFFTLREIFERVDPRIVRFFLVRSHYRTPIDFSDGALWEAGAALERVEECLSRCEEALGRAVAPAEACPEDFERAMDEDFNTAAALGAVFSRVNSINIEVDSRSGGWSDRAAEHAAAVRKCFDVLGIKLAAAAGRRISAAGEGVGGVEVDALLERASLTREEIEDLARIRDALRKENKFEYADRIRGKIREMGYDVRDDKSGATLIKRK